MAKQYLVENNVEFEDIDVSADQAAAQEMINKSGQMGVPVLDINGTIVIGFNKQKISELLKIQ
jgi:glutaredoxin